MNRDQYTFHPLSYEQYQAIIEHGSFPNVPEPMLNRPDYDSLIAVLEPANIDPRLPLAFTWAEGHDGTDPGLVAASVNNLGGIKFAGQPGTTDSGIPADTGGTYAAFPDLTGYWREWVRIMGNEIIGPDFNSGNLVGAVEHYTNGPGTGHNKVDKFLEYQAAYPPGGDVTATGVYGEDVVAYERTLIGQANSTPETDPVNGVHPWAYWCESLQERAAEHCGLTVVKRDTALDKGNAAQAQGLFRNGPPQHGDWLIFGAAFYAQGHIGTWDAEHNGGMLLGTLTDGTGIGYAGYGPHSKGYMGCLPIPGTVAPYRTQPVPVPPVGANTVPPNNPYNHGIADKDKMIGLGGGFGKVWIAAANPYATFGWPMTNEVSAWVMEHDGSRKLRTVQYFERGVFIYDAAMPPEWQVTQLLRTQTVVPL